MKLLKVFKYVPIFCVIISFIYCRKLVTDDLPSMEPSPVINALFSDDQPIKVHLSWTDGFDDSEFDNIENATVYLEENGIIKDTLSYMGDGIYQSGIIPKDDQLYKCVVVRDGLSEVSAESHMPPKQEIISVKHRNSAGIDEEGISYPAVVLEFTNLPEQQLYFEVVIKLIKENNDYVWNEEKEDWDITNGTGFDIPELINITDPLILNDGLPLPLFSNELIEGNAYTITLNYTTGSYSSDSEGNHADLFPLIVELKTISGAYYSYVKQLYLYNQGRYPYVFGDIARTFPLYSNVENGYGIFAGYATSTTDTIYPESLNHP